MQAAQKVYPSHPPTPSAPRRACTHPRPQGVRPGGGTYQASLEPLASIQMRADKYLFLSEPVPSVEGFERLRTQREGFFSSLQKQKPSSPIKTQGRRLEALRGTTLIQPEPLNSFRPFMMPIHGGKAESPTPVQRSGSEVSSASSRLVCTIHQLSFQNVETASQLRSRIVQRLNVPSNRTPCLFTRCGLAG